MQLVLPDQRVGYLDVSQKIHIKLPLVCLKETELIILDISMQTNQPV